MERTENSAGAICAGSPGPLALPILSAGDVPEWVMVAMAGRWEGHPVGLEEIAPAHLRSAFEHFERHYRANGAELPLDYHHASVLAQSGLVARAPAAGWVRQMELRAEDTELWARVLWTAEAAQGIAAREFRYLSPVLRFGAADRVTGRPVPMLIHSVALTNTPFLTELPALNEHVAFGGAAVLQAHRPEHLGLGLEAEGQRRGADTSSQEGATMPILAQMAAALGRQPDKLQQELGLESAEDVRVAERLVACTTRVREVEARLAETAAVGRTLGLPDGADATAVLNAVGALVEERRSRAAAALVEAAVAAGKIPPAQRDYLLNCALADMDGTRGYLDGLPTMLAPHGAHIPSADAGRCRALTEAERSLCKQLGLSEEAFLAAGQ